MQGKGFHSNQKIHQVLRISLWMEGPRGSPCHTLPHPSRLAWFVRIVHLPLNLERILASSLFILLISASLLLPANRSRYVASYVVL